MENETTFNLKRSLQDIWEKLADWVHTLFLGLPNFVLAVLVFIAFVLIARYLYRWVIKFLQKHNKHNAIHFTIARVLRVAIIGVGFFIALGFLHLDKVLQTILASVGILGLAISFAVQGTLKNTVSGFILSFMPEVKIGDWIETKGFAGEILEVNLRNIVIKEYDNNYVVIPNSQIVESPFKNLSTTQRSRVLVHSRVSFNTDLTAAENLVKKVLGEAFDQKNNEEIEVFYEEFGAESITFIVRFWTDVRKKRDLRLAQHQAVKLIKSAFDKNGIRIPYPKRAIYRVNSDEAFPEND